jgi:isochorismate synthase/2-succinyl-5-enolpyruvyl-6-hydroxy-3-cyclohexene-1-carboxylate synthase/2-succinyl-6-hydroxy-2,4-cyclohexadiene-1-carboxylate synthase/O-succinylbenzoate synthase
VQVANYLYESSLTILLQGRISSWIKQKVGLDPANLYPSVRCGLEGALLTVLAQAHNIPLAKLLHRQEAPLPATSADLAQPPEAVLVNGLLDWCGTIEACTQEALDMVAQGYSALKIKVCCLTC